MLFALVRLLQPDPLNEAVCTSPMSGGVVLGLAVPPTTASQRTVAVLPPLHQNADSSHRLWTALEAEQKPWGVLTLRVRFFPSARHRRTSPTCDLVATWSTVLTNPR